MQTKAATTVGPQRPEPDSTWDGLTRHRVFRAQHFLLHTVALQLQTDPRQVLDEFRVEGALSHLSEHFQDCLSRKRPAATVALFADALALEEPRLKQ